MVVLQGAVDNSRKYFYQGLFSAFETFVDYLC